MIYTAGPVTGFENNNREAFEEARRQMVEATLASFGIDDRARGGRPYTVAASRNILIPHEIVPAGAEWTEAMRICLRALTHADTLVYLPGSQDSQGAKLEMKVARALGIPVYSLEQYLKHLEHERK